MGLDPAILATPFALQVVRAAHSYIHRHAAGHEPSRGRPMIPTVGVWVAVFVFHAEALSAEVNLADVATLGGVGDIGPIRHLSHPSVPFVTRVVGVVPTHVAVALGQLVAAGAPVVY